MMIYNSSLPPHLLFLVSTDGRHPGPSGYTRLTEQFPEARIIERTRSEPRTLVQRGLTRIFTLTSASRWYRLSSAQLEWHAVRTLRRFSGVVHLLWGDRDLGYIHRYIDPSRHRLVVSFHACPDTLPGIFRHTTVFRHLDAIVLMSDCQREFFLSHRVPAAFLHTIHHGVDTTFFSPQQSTSHRSPERVVLAVGSYRRNFDRLASVAKRFSADSHYHFRVVLPPADRGRFSEFPNVVCLSQLTPEQLRSEYQTADCLLMTLDACTANNAILEAMACGLPVISEDVGGAREYIKDAGRLVPQGDIDALVDSIRNVSEAQDPHTLKAQARQRAVSLSWSRVAATMRPLYSSLINAPRILDP
jgi:glycosyltransferase involved in cell wall biosynthesis